MVVGDGSPSPRGNQETVLLERSRQESAPHSSEEASNERGAKGHKEAVKETQWQTNGRECQKLNTPPEKASATGPYGSANVDRAHVATLERGTAGGK